MRNRNINFEAAADLEEGFNVVPDRSMSQQELLDHLSDLATMQEAVAAAVDATALLAKSRGATWTAIGAAYGSTQQSASERWAEAWNLQHGQDER